MCLLTYIATLYLWKEHSASEQSLFRECYKAAKEQYRMSVIEKLLNKSSKPLKMVLTIEDGLNLYISSVYCGIAKFFRNDCVLESWSV